MNGKRNLLSDALLAIAVVIPSYAAAQDYYPLEQGNTWCYRVVANPLRFPSDTSIVQTSVVGDTLLPSGHVYTRLSSLDALGARYVRSDSAYVYYYPDRWGNEGPMYNLQAMPPHLDTVLWNGFFDAWLSWADTITVFGRRCAARSYTFGGLVRYDATLVEGFGIVHATDYADGEYPFQYAWDLQGCIIRDTSYGIIVSVPQDEILPTGFALSQNYPNPFNPSTTIDYELPRTSHVTLIVYDMLGRQVVTLVNGVEEPGHKSVEWNAANFASGVYFCTLQARPIDGWPRFTGQAVEDFTQTKPLMLIK
jgi:hypothetical protein